MKWPGHVSGIQRVAINFAKALIEQKLPVGFFCWDGHAFVEAPKADVARALETVARANPEKHFPVGSGSLRQRLFGALRNVYRRSPSWLQGVIFRVWQWTLALKARAFRLVRGEGSGFFSRGDWVLVVGNNWSEPYLPFLLQAKDQHGFRFAQVIYDFIPVIFPQYFRAGVAENYARRMREIIGTADLLLPISQHTKSDLMRFAKANGLALPRAEVIRLGDDFFEGGEEPIPELMGAPFVLTVGTIEVRKNHVALVKVWRDLIARGEDVPPLIMVGRKGWLVDEVFELIDSSTALREKIRHLDDANDQQLAWLYKNCLFTIYPSLYEGWGLPVAESLKYGKICIASGVSSIPEISDLVEFVDPRNLADIDRVVSRWLKSGSVRREKEEVIARTYRPTSWSETVAPFIKAIHEHESKGE
jgi:glycosyltransferase involved in cell wall biosynthesis